MPGSETRKERFVILGRELGPAARRLQRIFEPFGKVEVIPDAPDDGGIWYPDEELAGYDGLMGFSSRFPPITAWSRALYHLSLTLEGDEAVWFVEDDVAGHPALFEDLIGQAAAAGADLSAFEIRSREQEPEWECWNLAETWFDRPFRAFEPLCRVSAPLIRSALEFRRKHGRFTFHEVLFASLANERGMRCLEWSSDASKHLFGTFRYRPEVTGFG